MGADEQAKTEFAAPILRFGDLLPLACMMKPTGHVTNQKGESMAKLPLANRMHEELLTQLMDGTRELGEPLDIGALGRGFDVLSRELRASQTPLREALDRLERSGLVQREATRGYFVAPEFLDALAKTMVEPAACEHQAIVDAMSLSEPAVMSLSSPIRSNLKTLTFGQSKSRRAGDSALSQE